MPLQPSRLRLTCALFLGASLCMPATAAEIMVFCLEKADVRPWRTQDGGGLNIELLNRVARRLGVSFQYTAMPWKRCLAEVKANTVSGAVGASFKPDRLEIGSYPGGDKPDAAKRLNSDRYVLLRRKGSQAGWDGKAFRNLDGPVGIQLGYSIGDQLRALGVTVDDGAQQGRELALKLASGRLTAAATLEGEAHALLEADPRLAARLEVLPAPLTEKPYFLMLSNDFVNNRGDMARRIWSSIEEVRLSPDYQKLERQALGGPSRL